MMSVPCDTDCILHIDTCIIIEPDTSANSIMDPSSVDNTVTASLPKLESNLQIDIANGALMMYWHLDQQTMMYFTKDDKHLFRRELRLIRDKVNEGVFGEVKAGDNLTIGGRTVYTLLVGIEEMCPAYFLLRRRSLSDDFYYLPYLFVGENCRNNVLEWIITNTMSGKTTNDV